MHALHFFDHGPLVAALVALLLLVAVIAFGAAALPDIDLGGSGAAASSPPPVAEQPAGDPAWVRDPLAPPALMQ